MLLWIGHALSRYSVHRPGGLSNFQRTRKMQNGCKQSPGAEPSKRKLKWDVLVLASRYGQKHMVHNEMLNWNLIYDLLLCKNIFAH